MNELSEYSIDTLINAAKLANDLLLLLRNEYKKLMLSNENVNVL